MSDWTADESALRRAEEIGRDLPNDVVIGGALITMVEPDVGHEHAYNRWYEDDHFYAGAMAGPWTFAGKRWVAPRRLQLLRFPVESPVADPVTLGCYLSLYWTTAGHELENQRWSTVTQAESLNPLGRGFPHREHIYTAWHRYRGAARRPGGGPLRAEHALDHRFDGLVLEVVDADDNAEVLAERLHGDVLDELLFSAPFIPTDVGTDRYVDQLR
jgi:hypothetical protein